MKEIYDEKVQKVESKTPYFDDCYDDGLESNPQELEDDGIIHISHGRYRFCFYNGQGKGMLTEKSIPKFKKIVADVFKEDKNIDDLLNKMLDVSIENPGKKIMALCVKINIVEPLPSEELEEIHKAMNKLGWALITSDNGVFEYRKVV